MRPTCAASSSPRASHGQVTAVVRKDATEYAFYRGTSYVGQPPAPPAPEPGPAGPEPGASDAGAEPGPRRQLEDAEFESITMKQIQRLQERYKPSEPDQSRGATAGGFR